MFYWSSFQNELLMVYWSSFQNELPMVYMEKGLYLTAKTIFQTYITVDLIMEKGLFLLTDQPLGTKT